MRARRRGHARGIALAEALVALAVAAMTLLLLTSAGWGLRHAADRRAEAALTDAGDWLAARRILQGWTAGMTAARSDRAEMRLLGTPGTVRMVLSPVVAGLPLEAVGALRIVEDEEGGVFRVMAARHPGDRDVRTVGEAPRETELIASAEALRFSYLIADGRGGGIWRDDAEGGDLPRAIALVAGGERRLIAPLLVDRSVACMAALGPAGLEEPRCALR